MAEIETTEDLIKSLEAETTEVAPAAAETPPVPAKFKDLPVTEVYRSYGELESRFGRQGAELGELRKTVEQLKTQLADKPKEDPPDFYGQPDQAVRKIVREETAGFKETEAELRKIKMDSELRRVHPDYMEVAQSDGFQKWVVESPIRIELFARGDKNYEAAPVTELMNSYKAINRDLPKPEVDLKGVTLETGAVTGEVARRVYRSADLVALQRTDPRRYHALQPEIQRAYAEGRVMP